MNSRVTISLYILAWKMLGEHATPIGSHRKEYLPHGKIMVHILDASGSNLLVQYPILRRVVA
jgi:hypothetical protein